LSITDTKEDAFYLMMPSVAMIIQCWCKTDKISIWSTGGIIEGIVHLMTCHKGTEEESRYRSTHSVTSVADGGVWWNNDRGKLRYLGVGEGLPLCSPQIPHGLIWNQTEVFTVGIRDKTD
jgi:hypothetical protein